MHEAGFCPFKKFLSNFVASYTSDVHHTKHVFWHHLGDVGFVSKVSELFSEFEAVLSLGLLREKLLSSKEQLDSF